MSFKNYTKGKIRKVYSFVGYDRSRSAVISVPPQSSSFVDDEMGISGTTTDIITANGVSLSFGTVFSANSVGVPIAFYTGADGPDQTNGNIYVQADSVTQTAVVLSQSAATAGSVEGVAIIIL